MAKRLNAIVTTETAFSSWDDMLRSMERGYRPTVDCSTEAGRVLADAVDAAGHCKAYRRGMPKAPKTLRVELTPTQADLIDTQLGGREETRAYYEKAGVRFARTYVEGPADLLGELGDEIDPEERAMFAQTGNAQTNNEVLFAGRTAFMSAYMLRAKLNGCPVQASAARRKAMDAIF